MNIFKVSKTVTCVLCFFILFFISSISANNANAALGIVGSYTHPNMQGAWNSTISGNYAYVTAPGVNCLTILDITTVTSPSYVNSICDGVKLLNAYSVFVYGNYAYVVSRGADSLSIIDISNPAAPLSIVGYISDSVNLDTPVNVFVSGNYAFVTGRDLNRLTAVDISNPANPTVASSIQRNAELCGAWDVKIVGSLAYVTARGAGIGCPAGEGNRLTIINVSNPLAMSYVGSVKENEQLNIAYSVEIVGNYAYVTSRGNAVTPEGDRLTIVNISNPANPVIVGSVKDNNLLNGAKGVKVFGFMAYVSAYDSNTLTLVNISNPASPVISDSLTDPVNLSMPYGLSFRSGYSYVSSEGSSKFSIISGIPDTINPTLTTEAWRQDLAGVQVVSGGTVNLSDIDQAGEKVTIYSTASDDSGLIVDHKIRYWKNGVLQPVSSWATGGMHQLAINGPLAAGDLIEYQSEATDGAGNMTLDPPSGRYSFTVSIPQCCPASGDCTIMASPCYLGGDYSSRRIGINVNASPVEIILTGDLDLTNDDINFENQFPVANKRVIIDGSVAAGATANAKSIDWNSGSVIYPSGGLVIDLSVPASSTGNGGNLDMSGISSSAVNNSDLIIKTFAGNAANGPATTGGFVDINFTSNALLSGLSQIRTGADVSQLVNGGEVDISGTGAVGIDASVGFIDTSSSNIAGLIDLNGTGNLRIGLHANSCTTVNPICTATGSKISINGTVNYYAPSCNGHSLESKNNGEIDVLTTGLFDLPSDTTTGGGVLDINAATLSDCTCLGQGDKSCENQLKLNNTLNFGGVDCDPAIFSDPHCGSVPLPAVQFDLSSSSGAENATPVNLQVLLSNTSASDVTVNYSVTGGTATGGGVDYTLANGTATIVAGSLNTNIPITIVNDGTGEPDETIIVTLSNPTNASLGTNTVHVRTIINDDFCSGGIAITSFPDPITINVGSSGTVNSRLISTSTCDDTVNVTIDTAGVAPAVAIDLSWFNRTSVSVPVPAGGTVDVPFVITVPSNASGGPKVFKDNATSTVFGATATDSSVANIVVSVQFSSTVSNGSEGVTPANMQVSLSNTSFLNVSVNYSVTGGTATGGGVDYTLANGTATITAGNLATNIPISILEDGISEPKETIIITLSAPSNAALGANTVHTYRILDNEYSAFKFDYLIVKYDSGGNIISGWPKTYDTGGDDEGMAVAIDPSGNMFITGKTEINNPSDGDVMTIGYDSNGNILSGWPRIFDRNDSDEDMSNTDSIAVDGGNIYITNSSFIDVAQNYDYLTIKYDSGGNILSGWPKNYGGNAGDTPTGIGHDSSGNTYITGVFSLTNTYTIKYDPSGNLVAGWPKIANNISSQDLAVDSFGNIYLAGNSGDNFWTIKYDPSGNVAAGWPKTYDNGFVDVVTSMALDSLNNVYVTGESNGNFVTIKYDPSGNVAAGWPKTYDGGASEKASGIAVDSSNNIYVTGTVNNTDVLTLKYDPSGNVAAGWPKIFNNGIDYGMGIAIDPFGYVYVVGYTFPSTTFSILQPDGVGDSINAGDSYDINYSLNDPDGVVTAALYYDDDLNNTNGYVDAISLCGAIPESAGAICSWDTAGVTAGNYYVYGVTSDGITDYSGMITIGTSFAYIITDPTDTILITNSNTSIDIPLTKTSGNSQSVNLSYSAAPSNVMLGWLGGASSCSPNLSCVPTLALTINVLPTATPGTYPITITGTSAGLPDQSVTFNLTIVGASQSGNLEGFAWSDTVGWISFSSKDCDIDNNGIFEGLNEGGGATPAPLGCPVSGAAQTYGAVLDMDTNYLSGYAWSNNIGWISFEAASVAGCPSGVCQPRLDVSEFKGWARACSVFSAGCSGALKPDTARGGWDGWINLNESDCDVQGGGPNGFLDVACGGDNSSRRLNNCDVDNNGFLDVACGGDNATDIADNCDVDNNGFLDVACGGDNSSDLINVGYKVSYADPNLSGWAWGGDVMGWINFDGVRVRLGDNKPILTIFNQNPIDYCQKNLPGAVSLRWEYNDFEDGYGMQQAYEIEIDRSDTAFCRPGKQGDMITPNRNTTLLGTEINSFCPNFISYGGYTYTWKLRVFDSDNNFNSGSIDGFISSGGSFPVNGPTPSHEYPIANFSVDPAGNWIALMPITFDPFDASLAQKTESFGGSAISELMWSYGDATSYVENPVLAPLDTGDHDVQKSDYDVGIYTVDLKVTDSDGYNCWASDRNNQKTIDIMSNKPKWNEAAP